VGLDRQFGEGEHDPGEDVDDDLDVNAIRGVHGGLDTALRWSGSAYLLVHAALSAPAEDCVSAY
jgi:hypothetical protein